MSSGRYDCQELRYRVALMLPRDADIIHAVRVEMCELGTICWSQSMPSCQAQRCHEKILVTQ